MVPPAICPNSREISIVVIFFSFRTLGNWGKERSVNKGLTNLRRGKNGGDGLAITGEGTLMGKYSLLERCRVSGSKTLVPVLDLGEQALTGVFPRSTAEAVTTGPYGWSGARISGCCNWTTRMISVRCMGTITATGLG